MSGNTDDFDAFYAGSVRRVTGYLYAVTGSRAEAEDAAQEAFARAWQHWPKVSGYTDPEGWVRIVGFRIAVSAWHKMVSRTAAHRRHGVPTAAHRTGAAALRPRPWGECRSAPRPPRGPRARCSRAGPDRPREAARSALGAQSLRKTSEPLVPPKPNELDSTVSSFIRRACLGT